MKKAIFDQKSSFKNLKPSLYRKIGLQPIDHLQNLPDSLQESASSLQFFRIISQNKWYFFSSQSDPHEVSGALIGWTNFQNRVNFSERENPSMTSLKLLVSLGLAAKATEISLDSKFHCFKAPLRVTINGTVRKKWKFCEILLNFSSSNSTFGHSFLAEKWNSSRIKPFQSHFKSPDSPHFAQILHRLPFCGCYL